jgi:cytohesin
MTTPLHQAVVYGQVKELKRLLDQGANPNALDQDWDTPLHLAADIGLVEAVKILLQAGADPNARCRDGDTPLHRSLQDIAVAEMLFQAGAQMQPAAEGGTPLHYAAYFNLAPAIPFLLGKGAEIDRKDLDGNTPLHDATRRGNTSATLTLLRNGADHLIENDQNLTPLELGHQCGQYSLVLQTMQEIETPLHYAAYRGNLSKAQQLMVEKANPNARDDRGFPPLFYAVMAGHLAMTKLLLDQGADPHAVARFGANAVQVGVAGKQIEVLEYLLEQGVSPNQGDRIRGGNALHNASRHKSPEAIRLLIQHGAQINATDHRGRTPLDYAQEGHNAENQNETAQALIAAGGRKGRLMSKAQLLNEKFQGATITETVGMLAPYRTITNT